MRFVVDFFPKGAQTQVSQLDALYAKRTTDDRQDHEQTRQQINDWDDKPSKDEPKKVRKMNITVGRLLPTQFE